MKPYLGRIPGWKPVPFSPTARAEEEAAARNLADDRMILHKGVTRAKCPVCPTKLLERYRDPEMRRLGREQAAEMHKLNDFIAHGVVHAGPCRGKACRSTTPRGPRLERRPYAISWAKRNGPNVLGYQSKEA